MVIDVFFILMATFGFYFGFSFGLMRVLLLVISLGAAALAAMRFTPMTTDLIAETFDVDSPMLPFAAFLVTLIVVLMMARMAAKLLEETINSQRYDLVSQVMGGLMMSLVFTLLYSVLVTFFGQAHVIDLVFNEDTYTTNADEEVRLLAIRQLSGAVDTLEMHSETDSSFLFYGELRLGADKMPGNKYQSFISATDMAFSMLRGDTFLFNSKAELQVHANNKLICFCDSVLVAYALADTVFYHCTDKFLSSKSKTSFFYKYIEVIPKRGTLIMKNMLPFVQYFVDYMGIALEKIEKGKRHPNVPVNVFSTDDDLEQNEVKQKVYETVEEPEERIPSADSVIITIDTAAMPVVTPVQPAIEEDTLNVEYEG